MRESNFSFPSQNRAAICITSALYDRRALDGSALAPMINSLSHLIYLTSTSARIRETLCSDGGLERLVRILKSTEVIDRDSAWKWYMAFHCIVNIGIRGTEALRTRIVESGVVPVLGAILEGFLLSIARMRSLPELDFPLSVTQSRGLPNQREYIQANSTNNYQDSQPFRSQPTSPPITTTPPALERSHARAQTFLPPPHTHGSTTQEPLRISSQSNELSQHFPLLTPHIPRQPQLRRSRHILQPIFSGPVQIDPSMIRHEDVALALQLLAYISKYSSLREILHYCYDKDIFSIVEKYTLPDHSDDLHHWSGIIMRNMCRKDDKTGLRRCAYVDCNMWEKYPQEFAKCRRCRKAKFCSRLCQTRSWADGHKYWCIDRSQQHRESTPNTNPAPQPIPEETTQMERSSYSANYSQVSTTPVVQQTPYAPRQP